MSPLTFATTELRLVLHHAGTRSLQMLISHAEGRPASHSALEDHRTQTVGELLDAIDRIDPGLGAALMKVMYPYTGTEPDAATAAAVASTLGAH